MRNIITAALAALALLVFVVPANAQMQAFGPADDCNVCWPCDNPNLHRAPVIPGATNPLL